MGLGKFFKIFSKFRQSPNSSGLDPRTCKIFQKNFCSSIGGTFGLVNFSKKIFFKNLKI